MSFFSKKKAEPKKEEPVKPEPKAAANGAPRPAVTASKGQPSAPPPVDLADMQKRQALVQRMHSTFGQAVAVLMRSDHYKHHSLADLEWLVIPALMTGQFSVAEAQSKTQGFAAPVGVVTWASVSPEVEKRLSGNLERPARLRPDEWRSGDVIWVIDAVGPPKLIAAMLKRLSAGEWKGRTAKIRVRTKEGKMAVREIKGAKPA